MNTVNIEGKDYEVSGYAEDGLPIIQAIATSTQDGFDKDGNPKINTIINVPSIMINLIPGEIGE